MKIQIVLLIIIVGLWIFTLIYDFCDKTDVLQNNQTEQFTGLTSNIQPSNNQTSSIKLETGTKSNNIFNFVDYSDSLSDDESENVSESISSSESESYITESSKIDTYDEIHESEESNESEESENSEKSDESNDSDGLYDFDDLDIYHDRDEKLDTCRWKQQTSSCSIKTCGLSDLHPILDPKFNMREVAKQCLLLEDHLNNKKKRCLDCIKKHFLTIDGFLEEDVSLEPDNSNRDYYRSKYLEWVNIEKKYSSSSDSDNMDNVSKLIRFFRKPLVEEYFDIVSDYA